MKGCKLKLSGSKERVTEKNDKGRIKGKGKTKYEVGK